MSALSRRALFGGPRTPPLRAPGAVAEDLFVDRCSRCDACITACPEGVLKRGSGGYPEIDFTASGCTFCGACATACRDGAIVAQTAWSLKAAVGPTCLLGHGVLCRVCGDHCEIRAIRFHPVPGGKLAMTIETETCTGCGACLSRCPANALSIIRPQGDQPCA